MKERLSSKKVSLSLAAVGGILSAVCAVLIAISPEGMINLFSTIFHGIDINQIIKPLTLGGAILGIIEVMTISLVTGWLFAKIYNAIRE